MDVFPGFAAADTMYNEDGSVAGVRIGDMGVAQGRHAQARLHRRHRHQGQGHRARRRRARQPHQAADQALQAGPGQRSAGLLDRHQGTVAGAGRPRHAGQDRAQLRLARRHAYLWRQLPVPPGQGPHRARLRQRARLQRPEVPAVGSVPAVEEPSDDEAAARRRHDPFRRRARDRHRRLPVAADMRDARRAADRRHRRPAQRAQGQGHAPGDQERHARRRAPGRQRAERGRLRREAARLGR